ncbi:dTDP-6-deoxy-L-hexose 3-O-methyltransferase [Escherichia coli]|nr:dTDP-6-deoxy-L-hexose 3-O-methyltransferase [Escherichia coli]
MTTITKERIELFIKNPLENGLTRGEQMELARIALASLEAEPVAKIIAHYPLGVDVGKQKFVQAIRELPDFGGYLFAAPPAPIVPEEMYWQDAPVEGSSKAAAYATGWNDCREAMFQSGNFRENKDSSTNNFRKIPEASTSSPVTPALLPGGFTIEEAKELHEDLARSHISKALSGEKMKKKDRDADLRWIHGVIVQAAWFVKASLEQNALSGNSPVTPDGWISCSERMPDTKTAVLVARDFGRKGDWRMKWATYIPGHPDANDGWIIPGASWIPSHWMPLPEPPQEVRQ